MGTISLVLSRSSTASGSLVAHGREEVAHGARGTFDLHEYPVESKSSRQFEPVRDR